MTDNTPSPSGSRRGARLAAIQALYQIEMMKQTARQVIDEFVLHRFSADKMGGTFEDGGDGEDGDEGLSLMSIDRGFFSYLVSAVADKRETIDEMIIANLSAGWTFERLQPILRSILRAGVLELMGPELAGGAKDFSVPVKVVISEYVDVTHGFFDGKEPAFVNAILDRLAHRLREDELGQISE